MKGWAFAAASILVMTAGCQMRQKTDPLGCGAARVEVHLLGEDTRRRTVRTDLVTVEVDRIRVEEIQTHDEDQGFAYAPMEGAHYEPAPPMRNLTVTGRVAPVVPGFFWMGEPKLVCGSDPSPVPFPQIDVSALNRLPSDGSWITAHIPATQGDLKGTPSRLSLLFPVTRRLNLERVKLRPVVGERSEWQRASSTSGPVRWRVTVAKERWANARRPVPSRVLDLRIEVVGPQPPESFKVGSSPTLNGPVFIVRAPWTVSPGRTINVSPTHRTTLYPIAREEPSGSPSPDVIEISYVPAHTPVPGLTWVRVDLDPVRLRRPG